MPRVIFGSIRNDQRPTGGVKVVYQAAGALRQRGYDAYVASEHGMPAWLAGNPLAADARILDTSRPQRLAPRDLYFVSDSFSLARVPFILENPRSRRIFFQNHAALTDNPAVDWPALHHIGCLAVSAFTRDVLTHHGFRSVAVVSPGIDRNVFRPARRKRHRLCYMPRKWPAMAAAVRERVRTDVEWFEIDGRSEPEVAEMLAGSTLFVNFGRHEGFGLPAIEAMACGCVVAGFAGHGTLDYARRENGFWAREGDVDGCVAAIEQAIAAVREPATLPTRIAAGLATAARYDIEVFGDRLAAYVDAAFAGVEPAS